MVLEYGDDGTIRTDGLHWEGFPCLAWEALSATGVTVTMPLHPVHPDWFDLSFVYSGFRGHKYVESAALWVMTNFCVHNLTIVALSPFGSFLAVSPHDPAWLDRVYHLQELLLLVEQLDVMRTLTRCLNVLFTLQGLCYTTASVISHHLESARMGWHSLSAA
jgi:hypothetical protein